MNKKPFIFLIVLFLTGHIAFSQNQVVKQWDKRYGGLQHDIITLFQLSADGGFILAGYSISGISGDKTQDCWNSWDFWMVKADSTGRIEWDKDFGGTNQDEPFALIQTRNGGYLIGGYSYSDVGGDKTQSNWDTNLQTNDYWLVRLDPSGNKIWDKRFGGTKFDRLFALTETRNGGFILGGSSNSGVSGDKTTASRGLYDYWVIKIDSNGIKEWDKAFGGTRDDYLTSLRQTQDGGCLIGGYSYSGIGIEKSQNNWDTSGITSDYWIIKMDSTGTEQWDKVFGGTQNEKLYALQLTADGGYILGGLSASGINGDRMQGTWGQYDYWIVKTDSLGNKVWEKDYGGSEQEDEFGNISQTSDKGYLFGGSSYSNHSGDKSENNLGLEQGWFIKTDSAGNKEWDKTIFSTGHDESGWIFQTLDGCFAMALESSAGTGGYKSQPSQGGIDFWLNKFCDTTQGPISVPELSAVTINIFPNPTNGTFTIRLNSEYKNSRIDVCDVFGKIIYSTLPDESLGSSERQVFLNVSAGIYFVNVFADEKCIRRRIVVKK